MSRFLSRRGLPELRPKWGTRARSLNRAHARASSRLHLVMRLCLEPLETRTLLSAVSPLADAATIDPAATLLVPAVAVTAPSTNGDVVRAPGPYTIQWTATDPQQLPLTI